MFSNCMLIAILIAQANIGLIMRFIFNRTIVGLASRIDLGLTGSMVTAVSTVAIAKISDK